MQRRSMTLTPRIFKSRYVRKCIFRKQEMPFLGQKQGQIDAFSGSKKSEAAYLAGYVHSTTEPNWRVIIGVSGHVIALLSCAPFIGLVIEWAPIWKSAYSSCITSTLCYRSPAVFTALFGVSPHKPVTPGRPAVGTCLVRTCLDALVRTCLDHPWLHLDSIVVSQTTRTYSLWP